MSDPFEGFERRDLDLCDVTRPTWVAGSGPPVVVIHEVPGLHPQVIDFGRRLVREGFSVYMPSLFGTPGKKFGKLYSLRSIARACVGREFVTLASGKTSPITAWVRELARLAESERGGPVGAVGMCLTGGFALAMMVEDCVRAPVLSQPSLPFSLTRKQRRDLGVDDETLERIRERADVCVLGLRFTNDPMVPAARFERLREEIGDRFIAVEIDSSKGNPHGISRTAHSVLTLDLVDEPGHPTHDALLQVIEFFRDKLGESR